MSLARSALGGAGSVMVHYTRAQGLTDYVTEAKEVARAARDVGVRVGFAPALRDRNPLVYGPSEPILAALPPEAREEITRRFIRAPLPAQGADRAGRRRRVGLRERDLRRAIRPGRRAVVHALSCCEGIAEASARTGRRVHMHLLETRYQREWADQNFPDGIVRYLDEIGLLSDRASRWRIAPGRGRRISS